MKEYTNLKQVVDQLEWCKYTNEHGGPLENNTAFIFLKKLSEVEVAEPENEQEYFVTYDKKLANGQILKDNIGFMTKKQIESKSSYDFGFKVTDIKKL